MSTVKYHQIGVTLLLGAAIGRLIGNLFGFALSALLLTGLSILIWVRRRSRHLESSQAQQLLLFRALADQALRDGMVGSCPGCRRPMQVRAQRCLYCGTYRGDGPLR